MSESRDQTTQADESYLRRLYSEYVDATQAAGKADQLSAEAKVHLLRDAFHV